MHKEQEPEDYSTPLVSVKRRLSSFSLFHLSHLSPDLLVVQTTGTGTSRFSQAPDPEPCLLSHGIPCRCVYSARENRLYQCW